MSQEPGSWERWFSARAMLPPGQLAVSGDHPGGHILGVGPSSTERAGAGDAAPLPTVQRTAPQQRTVWSKCHQCQG